MVKENRYNQVSRWLSGLLMPPGTAVLWELIFLKLGRIKLKQCLQSRKFSRFKNFCPFIQHSIFKWLILCYNWNNFFC
ncbi:hypothetical protein EAW55_00210 [Legionella jordanis]|nr:hypothetical protein EAW55_00210 [Legionella jordanis]RMX17382.1 hypothetical protein EAS68_10840 [Legionella jordanis]